ncbi:hypothetical protein [Paracoccus chinensis]|uniref:Uncharacterized protein n=1 Tax=Paracoccus chinensis TaxID=525640 RepID=A0A1G9MR22_9RHOB|nr:hypothetical protein [Paracoccus chinensis]SDL76659.1 hypothetical protein SAMN04487971_1238 [Paracoccus chinensis]
MASRKKPGMILKRDHAFTEAIGKPGSREPNAFSMASEDAKAKLEAAQARGADRSVLVPTKTAGDPRPAEVVQQSDAPFKMDRYHTADSRRPEDRPVTSQTLATVSPEFESFGRRPLGGRDDGPPALQRQAVTEETGERREVIVSITVSQDLLERAARWGAVAHQPPTTVLRHALRKMKPQLLDDLKTVQARDVHQQRIKNVGYRLQSRLRFAPAELASLEARLDPAGFGILSSMLNHYARDSFARFLDKLMAEAGH